MKVCIIGNDARTIRVWWAPLLGVLREAGHEVLCCVPQRDVELEALCDAVRVYPLLRRGVCPWHEWSSFSTLRRLLREEEPDVIFASTVKPVIYGGLVRRFFLQRTRFYACITGLGACFERGGALEYVVSRLYAGALAEAEKVFFQNRDDRDFFAQRGMFRGKAVLCRGTGVNTLEFAYVPYAECHRECPTFLLVGRLLASKGIEEFVEAARLVRRKYPQARFQLLGAPECGGIDMNTVRGWHASGDVEYLGHVMDVRPMLHDASVIVLPSWREGTPCAILEAMSVGRAAVVTDVPGCREVVQDGVNGFVVPFKGKERRTQILADTLERFIVDDTLAPRMGAQGRIIAKNTFDAHKVARMLAGHMHLL